MSTVPIKQQTVVAQVMEEIRKLIASGAYQSGDRIPTEKELAERFGIGRSSIREAIKIFNYLGVLESRAALGTFVQNRSSISAEALTWSLLLGGDELEDLIDLRGSMELWSLIRLVDSYSRKTPRAVAVVAELEEIVEDMNSAADAGDRLRLIENDFRFHNAIIGSAGTPLFDSIFETLRSFTYDEIEKSQDDYQDESQIYREHLHLLKSIRSGRSPEILDDYIAHIENIKKRIIAQRA